MGCYSNTITRPVGDFSISEFYSRLSEPINGSFYFAGAAYLPAHSGYVTGAYYTGKNVAQKIIEKIATS